jgi:hypothetical protein
MNAREDDDSQSLEEPAQQQPDACRFKHHRLWSCSPYTGCRTAELIEVGDLRRAADLKLA